MGRKSRKSVNLLELTPVQCVPWETGENGCIVVLVPKFRNELLVRWLVPHMRYPVVRVKLDALGSFVWKMCDGKTTVAEISDKMTAEFGETAASAQERIRKFLLMLEKSDLVNLYDIVTSAQQ
ncbi:MAG: PqqD family protein [Bacteroidota bacterium]